MTRTFLVLAAAVFFDASLARAQEARTEVVELSNGTPLHGALVSIVDDRIANRLAGARFTDQNGRAVVRPPGSGRYRVRAEKVGYDTWTSVLLPFSRTPTIVRIGMAPRRRPIRTVIVKGASPCEDLSAQGTTAADLWTEIHKALSAGALAESQGLVTMDIDVTERVLDADLRVVSEHTDRRQGVTRQMLGGPGVPIDPGTVPTRTGPRGYRAPDAATLLSENFVKDHCFSAVRGSGEQNGLLGLEFKPAKLGTTPDFSGVFWLDPVTSALRYLVFDYVNLPVSGRAARARGRIDYEQLPTGEWFARRWSMRIPRTATAGAGASREVVVGYTDRSGIARARGFVEAAAVLSPIEGAERGLSGFVFDSTTGRPLRGVEVMTRDGRHRTSTNAAGMYVLPVDAMSADSLVFIHPRLSLLQARQVQPVAAGGEARSVVSLWTPSYATLRARLCPRDKAFRETPGIMLGYVKDPGGMPVPGAQVTATWAVLWVEQGGRLVSANEQRFSQTESGADGSYVLCGFNRNAAITARVSIAGRTLAEHKLSLPQSMAVEHDFTVMKR